MPTATVQGPAWDLSTEYRAPDSDEITADLRELDALLSDIESRNRELGDADSVAAAQAINSMFIAATTLLRNVSVFVSCLLSVDSRDESAQALQGQLKSVSKRLAVLAEPLNQFTLRADESTLRAYLEDPDAANAEFVVRHARKRRHELLSEAEETLASGLAQDGIYAWGSLYTQLSGTLKCDVLVGNETQAMGLAEAAGRLGSRVVEERENAWRAINAAWKTHEETCAASINAIAGWRLEMLKRRSHEQPTHYLDAPVHMSRITRETLDALLSAAADGRALAQRAARLQARAYGRTQIGPWDVRAPAPRLAEDGASGRIPFDRALSLVATSYAQVDPAMGSFVEMMGDKRWIEGTVAPNKRPGAYCTGFAKSRTPRVYMTYTGSASDVITLAHELGHAYHSWVMRDLPISQTNYGMSLAETASIFGETLVRDALLEQASTPAERLDIAWEELSALVSFVLNIPTRFEFEDRLYQRRAERPLRPGELDALMSDCWRNWYGDALEEPDPMFWASKLHFHIAGLSFYNFPYLFGYLFSLGVYSCRHENGADFFQRFNALLRDTGRMTAEDLARKHLDVDLTQTAFWTDTLNALAPRVDAFEALLDEVAPTG